MKTAVPVDGRFEHMVISCHVLSDHSIALMEFEFSNALNVCPGFSSFSLKENGNKKQNLKHIFL